MAAMLVEGVRGLSAGAGGDAGRATGGRPPSGPWTPRYARGLEEGGAACARRTRELDAGGRRLRARRAAAAPRPRGPDPISPSCKTRM